MRIIFQDDEADSVERVLNMILDDKELCGRIFKNGHERRNCRRISMKINWSRPEPQATKDGEAA
jgi:hypothetical protein